MGCFVFWHSALQRPKRTWFLSAMLRNGLQFAEWIADLTGRPSKAVDLVAVPDVMGWLAAGDATGVAACLPQRSNPNCRLRNRLSQWAASITTDASDNGIWRSYAE